MTTTPTADRSSSAAAANTGHRVLVLWLPDWPVRAAVEHHLSTQPDEHDPSAPTAVLDKGSVLACSPAARDLGVRRGMRSREAQSLCPQLLTLVYDGAVDARVFEPVLVAVEEISPGVEAIRPGMCAIAVRGASRYFGGELGVINALRDKLTSLGYPEVELGVADGPFAASQAARWGVVVPAGGSSAFLAELPVEVLDRPDLASLLKRMGLRTLGEFASLPSAQVSARFGTDGALAHRLAGGRDERRLSTRRPPEDVELLVQLDPPLDRVDTIAFAVRARGDEFISRLATLDLVATCVLVRVTGEEGDVVERLWRHPRWFRAVDVVDRVRWQVQGASTAGLHSAVALVQVIPVDVDRIGVHAEGLWGEQAPDERVHRALTRVQSMLGHAAVVTPVRSGGRSPAEHTTLVPWGDAPLPRRDPGLPWPGRLPDPAPPTVLVQPLPVQLLDTDGEVVTIDDRGAMSSPPDRIAYRAGTTVAVESWAGPWLSDERWWDAGSARQVARIQAAVTEHAYLLAYTATQWWIEASYD